MLIAHKIALAPNNVQRSYLARAAGTVRRKILSLSAPRARSGGDRGCSAAAPPPRPTGQNVGRGGQVGAEVGEQGIGVADQQQAGMGVLMEEPFHPARYNLAGRVDEAVGCLLVGIDEDLVALLAQACGDQPTQIRQ